MTGDARGDRVSSAQAVNALELVARDLATISRVRPDIGALLDDTGITRHIQIALHHLEAKSLASQNRCDASNSAPASSPAK